MTEGFSIKDVVAVVRRGLKEQGFSAQGTTFRREAEGGNTLLLSVQTSVKSTATDSLLTINYGVYSARIRVQFRYAEGVLAELRSEVAGGIHEGLVERELAKAGVADVR